MKTPKHSKGVGVYVGADPIDAISIAQNVSDPLIFSSIGISDASSNLHGELPSLVSSRNDSRLLIEE